MENEETINRNFYTEVSESVANQLSSCHVGGGGGREDSKSVDGDELAEQEPPGRRKEILNALEAVERDSAAIAESFFSLFSSLRLSLSQATGSTVEHMNCFSDAAGRLQECELIFSIHSAPLQALVLLSSHLLQHFVYVLMVLSEGLNEEMKDMDALATQLKILRRHVDALDSAVNRVVRLP